MYAIVVNLKLIQHNNWGIVGLQYVNVCIQRRPRWLSVFASISYVPFAFCRICSAASALHDVLRPDGTAPLFVGPNKELFCSSTLLVEQTEYVTFPSMSWNKRNQWRGWFAAITWSISLDDVTYCSLVTRRQHGHLSELSVPSLGARQQFLVEMTTENVAFVCTVRYSRCWHPINDCLRPR